MPDPTQKELIQLEVKCAIAREVEAYRKTVEAHQTFLEKSSKHFAIVVSTLAIIASAFFVYFFKHSVKEAVQESVDRMEVIATAKNQITNSISVFAERQIGVASNELNIAAINLVGELKKTTLRDEVNKALTHFPTDQLTNLVRSVPVGTIVAFGGPPADRESGWLECNGAEVQCAQYPHLFKAIGTCWGGDGVITFKLPDLRGMFLRGVDPQGTNDPDSQARINSKGQSGPNVGSFQPDAFQTHAHHFNFKANNAEGAGNGGANRAIWTLATDVSRGSSDGMVTTPVTLEGADSVRVSRETRPKNAYVHYIIKAQ